METIDGAKQHTSFRSGARAFSRHLDGIPGLRDMVEDWYRTEWWDRMSLGTLPQTLADELFEQAVNLGRGGAVRSLQRLCNALNYDKSGKRALFPDLAEDRPSGTKRCPPWPTFLRNAAVEDMVHWLNCLQGRITWPLPRKPGQPAVSGWLAHPNLLSRAQ
ncbi:MAG: glycosyl hydrolase 108 family protein [Bilophila wadsworthia]